MAGSVAAGKVTGGRVSRLSEIYMPCWGVSDEETFSARLEELSGRRVYNLAVASYGTYRELQRLERSGLVDDVDSVIIQLQQ